MKCTKSREVARNFLENWRISWDIWYRFRLADWRVFRRRSRLWRKRGVATPERPSRRRYAISFPPAGKPTEHFNTSNWPTDGQTRSVPPNGGDDEYLKCSSTKLHFLVRKFPRDHSTRNLYDTFRAIHKTLLFSQNSSASPVLIVYTLNKLTPPQQDKYSSVTFGKQLSHVSEIVSS